VSCVDRLQRPWYHASVAKNEASFSVEQTASAEADAPKKRGRRSSDKRERILRAAIKVFARSGFYSTRVNEIAKAAGVADGTIYLYFKNKEHVLISIFEDRISEGLATLSREVAEADGFEAKLRCVIDLQLGLFASERDFAEVITVNLRQSSTLLKQYARPLFAQYLGLIASIVQEGQESGEVREELNPQLVARSIWGALDGLALTWALSGEDKATPERLQRDAAQVSNLLLGGLRARS
jgi:TetR/AcrR family fatty acid metabolism transcriptional regulator